MLVTPRQMRHLRMTELCSRNNELLNAELIQNEFLEVPTPTAENYWIQEQ